MAKALTLQAALAAGTRFRLEPLAAARMGALLTVGKGHLSQWSYVERTLQTGYVRSVAKFTQDTERNGRHWLRICAGMTVPELLALVPEDERPMAVELLNQRLQRLEGLGCI